MSDTREQELIKRFSGYGQVELLSIVIGLLENINEKLEPEFSFEDITYPAVQLDLSALRENVNPPEPEVKG